MKVLYSSNKLSKLKYEVVTNNKTIPKKIIASLIIGSILGNIVKYQNNIVLSSFAFAFLIYTIISIYTYSFIFLNNKILSFFTATLILIGIYATETTEILYIVIVIDLFLLLMTPILNHINKSQWEKRKQKIKKERIEKERTFEEKEKLYQTKASAEKKYKYFTKTNSKEDIRKQYHKLIKIYHPDAETGETKTFNEIQNEYMQLMKELQNEE